MHCDLYLLPKIKSTLKQGGRKCCCRGGSEKFTGAVQPPPLHRTSERILETNGHGRSEIRKPSRGINAKLSRNCQRQEHLKPNVTFTSRHSRRNSLRKRLKASKLHSSGIGNYAFHVIKDKKIPRVIIHNILHISNFASSSARRENYYVLSFRGVVGMAAKLYGKIGGSANPHASVSFICSLPGHKMFENKTSKGTPFGMKSPVAKILVSKMNESPQAVLSTIPVTDYE
ncbi:hypothetical protein ALC56_09910 [Trachymyrmex septentrionalis]|uniref:Uncharacterized protein n=1 Tax=Trachymyrmex septentrionalis TaxID=34720 RepID=A0A195F548_9HYME|nr:hypothetical protein ALC56_09910 [Trachymyrmex septentrionalis]